VVWQGNSLGYLREFSRRVDLGEHVGQDDESQVGTVLEGFVEGVKVWLLEVGREISRLEHRLYKEQIGHHDNEDETMPKASTLLSVTRYLRPILSPAVGLSTLLRETVEVHEGRTIALRVRTGYFLSGMYRLVEREALLDGSASSCIETFVDLFFRSLRPYLSLIDQWATEGPRKGLDPREEFMIDARGALLHMVAVPCFLRYVADEIRSVGEEVNFLNNMQGEERRGTFSGQRVWVYKRGWRRERVNVQSHRRHKRHSSHEERVLPKEAADYAIVPHLQIKSQAGEKPSSFCRVLA